MKRVLFVFFMTIISTISTAQTGKSDNINIQQLMDDIIGTPDNDFNYEEIYENISMLLRNPVDINKAGAHELRSLYLLSEQQIQNLIHYREENGNLLSFYELQTIDGFDEATLIRIKPFLIVADPTAAIDHSLLNRMIHERNNYLLIRTEHTLEQRRGFKENIPTDQQFRGSPEKIYIRFRESKPGDFSTGLTLEKDAGEQLQWNSRQKLFDFTSMHIQLQNKEKLKNFILGDYQLQAGQGLLLGGLFGLGKGSEPILTARKINLGSLPYTGSNESNYWRGVTGTYEINNHLLVTGFYSTIRRDASLSADSVENVSVSSLLNSGLHRNEIEIKNKATMREINYGTIINYKTPALDAGIIWNTTNFEVPLNPLKNIYNQFTFNNTINHNTSLFINYTINNFAFFGELAKSIRGGYGVVGGFLTTLSPQFEFAFIYRNYQRDFRSFHANTMSENSTPQNEQGTYWGWKYYCSSRCTFSGYMDLFRFPWLKYRTYKPSEGYEWLLRINYQLSGKTLLYVQVREENKVRNTSEESPTLYQTAEGIKRNYIANLQAKATEHIQLKTRMQFSTYNFNRKQTRGLALIQDIHWNSDKFDVVARYALFDTDDYDNRQYSYEDDVWLAFSIPAYSGQGLKNILMVQYTVTPTLQVSVRYGHTRYTDRESIGTGLNTIEGNELNEIKLQARVKL